MIKQENIALTTFSLLANKWKDYQALMKLKLSLLVVFSSVIGYIIVPNVPFNIAKILALFIGGLLVTGAANAANQIWETEEDKLMKRTKTRPLPEARMHQNEALFFIVLTLSIGLFILFQQFNSLTAVLSLLSFGLYVFVYTPLKKISPISVLVGAIPGSLPCLIGWVAGSNELLSIGAWTLFALQFFWQFPHFWSIAWIANDDYSKAGMKMLPQTGKDSKFTAMQCVLYSALLIPLGYLPFISGLTSIVGTIALMLAGIGFTVIAFQFLKENSDLKARKLMFASFIYLPIILFVFLIDKFI